MKKFYFILLHLLSLNFLNAQEDIIGSINEPASLARVLSHSTDAGYPLGEFISTRNPVYRRTTGGDIRWAKIMTIGENITADVVVYRDTSSVDTVAQHGCLVSLKPGVDVRGKIALIRRGTCAFSDKAYAAWKNGAVAVIIYDNRPSPPLLMSPTPPKSDSVNIPVFALQQQIGESIRTTITGGTKVNMTFKRPILTIPSSAYNYSTPIKEVNNLRELFVGFINPTNSTKRNVTFTASVKSPNGTITNLTSLVDSIKFKGDTIQYFGFPQYPLSKTSLKGKYTVTYKNTFNADSISSSFILNDGIFAHDDGQAVGRAGLNQTFFARAENAYMFDYGNVYLTGKDTTKATHVAFALNNIDSFPKDDIFTVKLYKLTAANYNKLQSFYSTGQTLTYNDIKNDLASQVQYKLKKTEKRDSLIFVELPSPVDLADSTFYAVVVQYDGLLAGINTKLQCPLYTWAGTSVFPTTSYFIVYYEPSDGGGCSCFVMDPEGFGNNINVAIRLYTRDARITGTKDLPALAENQVKLFPNPVSDNVLNIDFALQNVADVVNIHITDLAGKTISVQKLYNVKDGVQQVQLGNLANGSYFATIVTKEGWRTKVFQVLK